MNLNHPQLVIPRSSSLPVSSDERREAFQAKARPSFNAGPITPPVSPGHTEHEIDIDMLDESLEQVDEHFQESENMLLEQPPSNKPLRLLEDEPTHVERSGRVKLTDFEVKGTLGMSLKAMLAGGH
jgi:protein kinase A